MNILVTGGGGYVGSVLVPMLIARGCHVRVLDLFLYGSHIEKTFGGKLESIRGDIRDPDMVRKATKSADSVIHLAAVSNDPSYELDPTLAKSINHDGTMLLINEAKKAGVKRFIFASSSSVYGVKKEKNVTEDMSLVPLTDYSKYKAVCEKYALARHSQAFTVVVVRPATVCGYAPRMRFDLTVNLLTIHALVNGVITVFGGSQKRPNIHITDMAEAYIKILFAPTRLVSGQIFNIGYENYSVRAIADMVKRVLKNSKITIITKQTDDLRSYHISSAKIKKVLGFIPKHTVEEAIGDIAVANRRGLLKDALTASRYYNIKTMKEKMVTHGKQ